MAVIASDTIELTSVKDINDTATNAENKADTAQEIADATAEHFWSDSEGAHVSKKPQSDYPSGGNTLITSDGMEIRDGTTKVASFGASGATIGRSEDVHTVIDNDSFAIEDGSSNKYLEAGLVTGAYSYDTESVEINGTTTLTINDQDELISIIPGVHVSWRYDYDGSPTNASVGFPLNFLTFGTSGTYQTNVNYSGWGGYTVTITCDVIYDGDKTISVSLSWSNTPTTVNEATLWATYSKFSKEPVYTIGTRPAGTKGMYSIAIGDNNLAVGENDVAVGMQNYSDSHASYKPVHTFGRGLKAWGDAIISVGEYNDIEGALPDGVSDYHFNVGNGYSDDDRSNALVLDSSGNLWVAGAVLHKHEKIRNSISLTTSLTNYGMNSNELSQFQYIEIRVYNASYMTSEIFPIETIKTKVNGSYPIHTFLARLGSTNYYLQWQYNDDTHLKMSISGGSNIYAGIFGIR